MSRVSIFKCSSGRLRRSGLPGLVAALFWLPAMAQSRNAGYVTARSAQVTGQMEAYGQVEPIAVLPVSAAQAGIVAGLRVLPGSHVRKGQPLAQLNGPEITALLLQSRADVRGAQGRLAAAGKSLAIERQQLAAHLSTRQAIHQAESAMAQAQAAFDNAGSHLEAVQQMRALSAPADGTVLAVNAVDGQLVQAGQPILTLQPADRLWLRATYYGADLSAIRVGMAGTFTPSDESGEPVAVRVSAVFGSVAVDGGESIGLVPTARQSRWVNGESGTVTLSAPPSRLVAIPTSALILDRGKWWVLVHTPHGDRPQAVVPGPTRGWQTFLKRGLRPGVEVVVENAYLLFHRGISQSYQPPD